MSHDTPQGAIRPKPAQEILQGILCELEAAADLVEHLLTHGRDQQILDAVTKSITAMADMLTAGLDGRNDAMASQWEREQQARQAEAMTEIHAAIDANPVLRHLRSEAGCPVTWGRAIQIDHQLQQDRQWAGKPVADRLAEVVNRLADLGLVAVEDEVSL